MDVKIVYEDAEVLVCAKSAGLATETARIGQPDVVSQLKSELSRRQRQTKGRDKSDRQLPYLGVVHRLDQPVEGLLVFGRTKKAAAVLSAQLGDGTLCKRYRAAVCGQLSSKEGELVDYLYKDAGSRAVVVSEAEAVQRGARRAVLHYRVEGEKFAHEKTESVEMCLSLLDIHIDTGRFHQIRAQMSHAGHPLLGDQKYGDERSRNLSRLMEVRDVALCAYSLEFFHPTTGKYLQFETEPQGQIFRIF